MNEFILYLLKASLGILVFYLVYWTTLRKETFFEANRVFLVSSLLISLVLPFIGFTYTSYVSNAETGNVFVELNKNIHSISNISVSSVSSNNGITLQSTIFIIYITGLIIFSLRILWQCIDLIILLSKHRTKRINGLRIIENNKYGLPFSFFNLVFINPNFHSGTDLTNILAHEKVHICENHWFDLLIVELFTVVFWFNPFVWLFERSIKQNHEYLADEGVLAQGFSIGRYQAILINQIMGMQIIGLTNNLNYSLNKKRMKMMTKMKTPKIRAFRMIWALPAVALLLVAFAKPAYVMEPKTNPTTVAPQKEDEQKIKVEAKVVDESGMPLEGASIVLYGKYEGAMTDNNGMFSILMTKTDKIAISFVGYTSLVKDFSELVQNGNNAPITLKLIRGVIKLDINKILNEGEPKRNAITNASSKKENDETFIAIESLPEYPGGLYALAKEIKERISKFTFSEKIEVGLTIDKTGKATEVYILGKAEEKIQTDLIIFFLELKKWRPGMQRGKAVPVSYNITINQ